MIITSGRPGFFTPPLGSARLTSTAVPSQLRASVRAGVDLPFVLTLPQNVTPLVAGSLDQAAVAAINAVNAVLTTDELRALNARSTQEKLKSSEIASDWLTEKGLV